MTNHRCRQHSARLRRAMLATIAVLAAVALTCGLLAGQLDTYATLGILAALAIRAGRPMSVGDRLGLLKARIQLIANARLR
jgi:hypothetical protein